MMAMIPMKKKLWMSETKDGVYAYFFRADKSDCNGYALCKIDRACTLLYN